MSADGMIHLTARHPAVNEPLTLEARGTADSPEKVAEAEMLVATTSRRG